MYTEFNLKDCMDEILLIIKFKAEYLGVKINSSYKGFDS